MVHSRRNKKLIITKPMLTNWKIRTFFDCHIASNIVKNRRKSELVAKNITMSSEFSRTSWQENSCKLNLKIFVRPPYHRIGK